MNISRSLSILGAVVLSATAALAAPLPTSYIANNITLTVNTTPSSDALIWPNTVTVPTTSGGSVNLIGGGFKGTFSGGTGNLAAAATTVWCIDSQLYVNNPTTAQANVTSLSSPINNDLSVRYSSLTGNSAGTYDSTQSTKFVYDIGLGASDSALIRYRMAAFLVSQYSGFPSGPTPNAADDALQLAIWKVIYNNSAPNRSYNFTGVSTGAGSWIDQARQFALNSANDSWFNTWAIVSWGVNPTSGALSGAMNSNAYQTFLVQIVPEPGFYGLLTLGLGGLFLAARRRRTQQ